MSEVRIPPLGSEVSTATGSSTRKAGTLPVINGERNGQSTSKGAVKAPSDTSRAFASAVVTVAALHRRPSYSHRLLLQNVHNIQTAGLAKIVFAFADVPLYCTAEAGQVAVSTSSASSRACSEAVLSHGSTSILPRPMLQREVTVQRGVFVALTLTPPLLATCFFQNMMDCCWNLQPLPSTDSGCCSSTTPSVTIAASSNDTD